MKMNGPVISRDRSGELQYNNLNAHIRGRYQPDTPLDKSFVPYLIMLFCAVVDCSVFLSLFKMISYDSPFMLGVEVAGFLFAFDVVPIYIGIQLRRMKQGLSKDGFVLWLALSVCLLACIMNAYLRCTTIELMAPDQSDASVSYFGTAATAATDEEQGIDPTALALTVFGIGLPMLTSVGSFFISYLTYNPLRSRIKNIEQLLSEKNDEIRRLDAALSEYEAEPEFDRFLYTDDKGKFEEMKKLHRAKTLSYCEYVRQRLKEYLADPVSNNALSAEDCQAILTRLDEELAALNEGGKPTPPDENEAEEVKQISETAA